MRVSILSMVLVACGSAAPETTTTPEGPGPEITVSLRLTDQGPTAEDIPQTQAWLALIHRSGRRDVTPLGTLQGVCTHEAPDEGDLLRARCWWAGAGTLLRVRRDGSALLVQRIERDETSGTGEPEDVERVELPARAQLSTVTP